MKKPKKRKYPRPSKPKTKIARKKLPKKVLPEKPIVTVGPPKLTRFERARIIGARSLQLALGAPLFIPLPPDVKDPIGLAIRELESRALPISIRRSLPDGRYEDIPVDWLLG